MLKKKETYNKKEAGEIPNSKSIEAMKELEKEKDKIPTFNTVDELFKDLEK